MSITELKALRVGGTIWTLAVEDDGRAGVKSRIVTDLEPHPRKPDATLIEATEAEEFNSNFTMKTAFLTESEAIEFAKGT